MPMTALHTRMKTVQRSAGRSSVATAAYISGSRLRDERQGMTFDYTRKERVYGPFILGPGGYRTEREEFWNRLEKHHKRGDAITSRTFEFSLPDELADGDAERISKEFAIMIADHYHCVVGGAVHQSRPGKNTHVHLQFSACTVGVDGTLGKKINELDSIHCQRHGIETAAEVLRPALASLCNEYLEKRNIAYRIEHLAFAEQDNLNSYKLPTMHVGKGIGAGARRKENDRIREHNAEIDKAYKEYVKQAKAKELASDSQRTTTQRSDKDSLNRVHQGEGVGSDNTKAGSQIDEIRGSENHGQARPGKPGVLPEDRTGSIGIDASPPAAHQSSKEQTDTQRLEAKTAKIVDTAISWVAYAKMGKDQAKEAKEWFGKFEKDMRNAAVVQIAREMKRDKVSPAMFAEADRRCQAFRQKHGLDSMSSEVSKLAAQGRDNGPVIDKGYSR